MIGDEDRSERESVEINDDLQRLPVNPVAKMNE